MSLHYVKLRYITLHYTTTTYIHASSPAGSLAVSGGIDSYFGSSQRRLLSLAGHMYLLGFYREILSSDETALT